MKEIEVILQLAEQCKGDPDEFINILEKIFKNVLYNEKGKFFFNIGRFLSLSNFSYFNLSLHSWKHALKYFINNDRYDEIDCYINLGNTYQRLGDYTKAIEYEEKALVIAKEIGAINGELHCYANLGHAYAGSGNHDKAIEFNKKALDIAIKIGDISVENYVNFNIGRIYYDENKPEIAYNYFKRSIELTEVIGGRIVEEQYKMGFYAASRVNAYQLMVPICLRLNKEKEAFEYTEKSKSKVFLYLLAVSNIRPSVAIVTSELKSLLDDEENYLIKLRQIQTRHSRSMTSSSTIMVGANDDVVSPHVNKGGEAIDSILSALNKIHDKIERIDPEYVFLRRGRPLPLDKIQNILLEKGNNHDNTIVIEYFITKDKVFIFVISPHEFHIKTVQLSEEKIASYIRSYWREVVNYPIFGYIGSSWLELSDHLIEPISEYLSKAELIYFVPHGLLHYIPMHALELNGEPLIKSHAVVYSPSASLLQFYRNKGSGLLNSCASFGVVFKDEAEEIARLFNITPQLDATKNIVLENLNNDILHFSCHGYFNERDPLSSGILLYSKDNIIIERNILSAREIFNLKLNAELVTLSACQTGINETKPGDELIGLTRALIYAGTSSVIVSLWSVNAASTQELMIEFYKLLKDGKDTATALQQAELKIMSKEEYSHPYYWSPFILVGDWE